jgi:hypothetical protein
MEMSLRNVCCVCRETTDVLKACGRCKTRTYCGRECQRRDWESGHKLVCVPLVTEEDRDGLRVREIVNGDPFLLNTMSMLVYGMLPDVESRVLGFMALVCVNKPWLPANKGDNVGARMFCVYRMVPRDSFVRHVSQHMRDTGHDRMLGTPYLIPRLMIRCVRARVVEGGRGTAGKGVESREVRTVEYAHGDTFNNYLWTDDQRNSREAGRSVLETKECRYGNVQSGGTPCTVEQMKELGKRTAGVIFGSEERLGSFLGGRLCLDVVLDGEGKVVDLAVAECTPGMYALADPEVRMGCRVVVSE